MMTPWLWLMISSCVFTQTPFLAASDARSFEIFSRPVLSCQGVSVCLFGGFNRITELGYCFLRVCSGFPGYWSSFPISGVFFYSPHLSIISVCCTNFSLKMNRTNYYIKMNILAPQTINLENHGFNSTKMGFLSIYCDCPKLIGRVIAYRKK
jgi:hypothetical protein